MGSWPTARSGGHDGRASQALTSLRAVTGRARNATSILVVDGNNVIGAVADGWWRDRPAAVRRLLARLQCLGERATLVLDVTQPDLVEGDHEGITVRYATRRGRDAADDLIHEIVAEVPDATVVTLDHALRHDVSTPAPPSSVPANSSPCSTLPAVSSTMTRPAPHPSHYTIGSDRGFQNQSAWRPDSTSFTPD